MDDTEPPADETLPAAGGHFEADDRPGRLPPAGLPVYRPRNRQARAFWWGLCLGLLVTLAVLLVIL